MSRSRSAGIASNWVRCKPRWPGWRGWSRRWWLPARTAAGTSVWWGIVTGTADPAAARAVLVQRLPGYMVPAAIVALVALPLTPERQTRQTRFCRHRTTPVARGILGAPGSAVEEILAGIYAQVLGVDRVGVDDSFFELGGDSLSAMRLIAAINTGMDADLSVRAVFAAPTVAGWSPDRWGWGATCTVGAGAAAGGGAVVVCPVPVVVPGPVAGALPGLQHDGRVAADRAAGRRGVGGGAGRCGGPP